MAEKTMLHRLPVDAYTSQAWFDREYGAVDKSCLGLKPAAVDMWRGMLFVHPDPDAGSIIEWFGDVEPMLGPHNVEELVEYADARKTYEVRANWKIVVENYIDVYHLSHLHSGTLGMYDHARAEYGFVGPHFAFWEPPSDAYGPIFGKTRPIRWSYRSSRRAHGCRCCSRGSGLARARAPGRYSSSRRLRLI